MNLEKGKIIRILVWIIYKLCKRDQKLNKKQSDKYIVKSKYKF